MTQHLAFRTLVAAAALRYRRAGFIAYHFARGKLGGDPVFAAILRQGLIPDKARVIDLGCGQGVLLALLAAAQEPQYRADWPQGLPPLPRDIVTSGVDLRADAIEAARVALGNGAQVVVSDVRDAKLGEYDVVTILDVLHYLDFEAQWRLLERVYAALAPGGRLLLRAGDTSQGWRFRFTLVTDWLITLLRGRPQHRFFCRSGEQWLRMLRQVGFETQIQPMCAGTPFANVLLVGRKP
ncbi:MAG TPA: methyltransferase domain-containing protein [Burkholderiaceae bacterium]|jgi:2-polyprenyl-3-methyl-5-hydroxy-6-metoxy-1,4-benzoquinol methylase|nr:methyltransferase domain-containing protein [Burkholderiaceae bacterium]